MIVQKVESRDERRETEIRDNLRKVHHLCYRRLSMTECPRNIRFTPESLFLKGTESLKHSQRPFLGTNENKSSVQMGT